MVKLIVPRDDERVKLNCRSLCCWPGCGNVTVPGHLLCPDCEVWERIERANQDAERQTCLAGVGWR